MTNLKYIQHYPEHLQIQIQDLIQKKKLTTYLISRYPKRHNIKTDKALYEFTNEIKQRYLKRVTLNKVLFDGKVSQLHNALGIHTFKKSIQGNKIKSKNEIKISTLFKNTPEEFLQMIIIHELAHFKEKEHNKSFYNLCTHMERSYHQYEFDLRIFLTHLDIFGEVYK